MASIHREVSIDAPPDDLLPHELAPGVTAMIEQGLAVMKRAMEASVDR